MHIVFTIRRNLSVNKLKTFSMIAMYTALRADTEETQEQVNKILLLLQLRYGDTLRSSPLLQLFFFILLLLYSIRYKQIPQLWLEEKVYESHKHTRICRLQFPSI